MTFATQLSTAFSPLSGNYDSGYVTAALSWVESFVQGYCNQSFDLVSNDLVYVDPHFGKALLPFIPVVSVSLVEGWLPTGANQGMTWTAITNYQVSNDTGFIYNTTGLPGVPSTTGVISWPWLPESLRVTYTHGYSVVPQPLVDCSVRLALQYLENPSLLMLRRVGDIEYRYSGQHGLALSDLDKHILDRYSIVSIA